MACLYQFGCIAPETKNGSKREEVSVWVEQLPCTASSWCSQMVCWMTAPQALPRSFMKSGGASGAPRENIRGAASDFWLNFSLQLMTTSHHASFVLMKFLPESCTYSWHLYRLETPHGFWAVVSGAAGGDRTHDPWLRRPILYPLSYSRNAELIGGCA